MSAGLYDFWESDSLLVHQANFRIFFLKPSLVMVEIVDEGNLYKD